MLCSVVEQSVDVFRNLLRAGLYGEGGIILVKRKGELQVRERSYANQGVGFAGGHAASLPLCVCLFAYDLISIDAYLVLVAFSDICHP